MAAPTFTIEHLDHDGALIETLDPVGGSLRWRYQLAQHGGPGWIQADFPLSHPLLTADLFAARRTDWQLVALDQFGSPETLMAGITGPTNLGSSESTGTIDVVRFSGADWLAWLLQPPGFFDYSLTMAQHLADGENFWRSWLSLAGTNTANTIYSANQETVIQDLIESLERGPDWVDLDPVFDGAGWAEDVDTYVPFGDTRNVLEIILDYARLGDPYGFDIWVEPDKTVRLMSPRNVTPESVSPYLSFTDENSIVPPHSWTNNGPIATDTIVMGTGENNTRDFDFKFFQGSRDTYRQWAVLRDIHVPGNTFADSAADAQGYHDREPQKDLRLVCKPDKVDPVDSTAGFRNLVGLAVEVTYNMTPYHLIDANFWVTGQELWSDRAGNWLCEFTLEQIY